MLFSEAATEYMADKRKRLRATTLEGYESALRCHVLPAWGGREVESITYEELQAWVDGVGRPGAAEKAFKTFRQVFRWALRRRQLRIWDVTQGIELPRRPPVRRPTLTADQERETLRGIVGQPFEAAVLLGAASSTPSRPQSSRPCRRMNRYLTGPCRRSWRRTYRRSA